MFLVKVTMSAVETRYNNYIERWLKGQETGRRGNTGISRHIRKYLFQAHNNSCQLCNWSEINNHTNLIPLEIHHIDGNRYYVSLW